MFTAEQAVVLAAIEQVHGRVVRVYDEHPVAERLLARCVTGTRVYFCLECKSVLFTIEPDGEFSEWLPQRSPDLT